MPMIIKTKGTERIEFATMEEAAADAGMTLDVFSRTVKKGRKPNGWKYTEVAGSPKTVEKPVIVFEEIPPAEIKEAIIEKYGDQQPELPLLITEPIPDPPPPPAPQSEDDIAADFFLTNVQRLINRSK